MVLAPFLFPGNGGSADATQDFAPAQNRFSTLLLNSSQNRFGSNLQSCFPSSTSPGFPLGHTSAPALGAGRNAGYTPDYAPAPSLTQRSMTFPDTQMLSLARRHSNVWKCHLVGFGNADQQQYCRTVHLSLKTL